MIRSKYTVPELYAVGVIKAWSKQCPVHIPIQHDYFDAYDVFDFVKDMLNCDMELTNDFKMFIDRTIDRVAGRIYT